MQIMIFHAQEKAGEIWTWSEQWFRSIFTKLVIISQPSRPEICHLFSLQIFLSFLLKTALFGNIYKFETWLNCLCTSEVDQENNFLAFWYTMDTTELIPSIVWQARKVHEMKYLPPVLGGWKLVLCLICLKQRACRNEPIKNFGNPLFLH